ncbi:MAG: hypothetical protein ACYDGR_10325, partial [Candidatus Dormibacteria bacterium]
MGPDSDRTAARPTSRPPDRDRPRPVTEITVSGTGPRTPRHWPLVVGCVVAVVARVTFWLYTGRVWEDALITVTHARNAVDGLGLTHHPGEGRVQGFSSALSLLVSLAGEMVHRGAGINTLRVASLVAAVAALAYGYLLAERLRVGPWAVAFLLTFLALDYNQVFYGMGGMETQMATAILLAATYYLLVGRRHAVGVCLGLALLARPDFVLFVVPALLFLFLRDRRGAYREAGWTLAVVAPWVAFTTLYYGSPIPQTIIAKAAQYTAPPSGTFSSPSATLGWLTNRLLVQLTGTLQHMVPFYSSSPVIDAPLPFRVLLPVAVVVFILAIVGCVAMRKVAGWWVVSAYLALFLGYRILFLPASYFGWYMPPFTALLALAAAAGIGATFTRYPLLVKPLVPVLVLLYALPIVFIAPLDRQIQREIEVPVRERMGLYLHQSVASGQSVVAEPAGYVGYYGRVKLYDFPGLTSPTVSRALGRMPRERRTIQELVVALRPDWIVFRPDEIEPFQRLYPDAMAKYRVVRRFSVDVPLEHWGVRL